MMEHLKRGIKFVTVSTKAEWTHTPVVQSRIKSVDMRKALALKM
jgi:hypothetical protein